MDDGELIATRLIAPGPFSMTAGVNVPFGIEMLEPICMLLPQRMGNRKLSRIAEDRRFAEAVYKVGLADGVMDRLAYLDLPDGLTSVHPWDSPPASRSERARSQISKTTPCKVAGRRHGCFESELTRRANHGHSFIIP